MLLGQTDYNFWEENFKKNNYNRFFLLYFNIEDNDVICGRIAQHIRYT